MSLGLKMGKMPEFDFRKHPYFKKTKVLQIRTRPKEFVFQLLI
jgi:hypothetical protein